MASAARLQAVSRILADLEAVIGQGRTFCELTGGKRGPGGDARALRAVGAGRAGRALGRGANAAARRSLGPRVGGDERRVGVARASAASRSGRLRRAIAFAGGAGCLW